MFSFKMALVANEEEKEELEFPEVVKALTFSMQSNMSVVEKAMAAVNFLLTRKACR